MWMLEHLSRHSHGFYILFCAGKVFPYMDGDILPVLEGKLPGIVFNTDFFGNFPHSVFLKDIFWKIPAFPREECSPWLILEKLTL
jgi:hypothetical protein